MSANRRGGGVNPSYTIPQFQKLMEFTKELLSRKPLRQGFDHFGGSRRASRTSSYRLVGDKISGKILRNSGATVVLFDWQNVTVMRSMAQW